MIIGALRMVFRRPVYGLIAAVTSFAAFALAVWLPNIRLITHVIASPEISFAHKVDIPVSLLGSIATNFTALSAFSTIAIALLSGVNVALIAYYVRRQQERFSHAGAAVSALGIMSGSLGMGCAACGSLILTSVAGTVGGTAILPALPLRGGEFGILGILLLATATYLLCKQIMQPAACSITDQA